MAAVDVEKHVAKFASKLVQAVVQSRAKKKVNSVCDPNALTYFSLVIDEDPKVQNDIVEALGSVPDTDILDRLPICVEIFIKNDDGEEIVIEQWSLSFTKFDGDQLLDDREIQKKSRNAYSRLRESLISILTISRAMVGHRLAQDQQQPDGYQTYHRIHAGQPHTSDLGAEPRKEIVSEVILENGMLQLSVAMRVQMTEITSKERSPELRIDNLAAKEAQLAFNQQKKTQPIDIDKPIETLLLERPPNGSRSSYEDTKIGLEWLTSYSSVNSLNSRACDSPLSNKGVAGFDQPKPPASDVNALNASVHSLFISTPKPSIAESFSSASHSAEDNKYLRTAPLPFVHTNSNDQELTDFLQDCISAPQWHELNAAKDTAAPAIDGNSEETPTPPSSSPQTRAYNATCRDETLTSDDITKQLEAHQSSLQHYEAFFASYGILDSGENRQSLPPSW